MRISLITLVSLGLMTTAPLAAERRQHDAHEHGHAEMRVVLDGAVLAVEIEAPGMDIVGFEHQPKTRAEKSKVRQALEKLESAAPLFGLSQKAECSVTVAHAEHSALRQDDDHHSAHKEHAHKEHAHKEHAHKDDDHADEPSTHSAFHAHYEWTCKTPEALNQVDVRYFDAFPATAEIDAMIIGPNGQTAQELTAKSTRIKF
jgi:hypothetical protein